MHFSLTGLGVWLGGALICTFIIAGPRSILPYLIGAVAGSIFKGWAALVPLVLLVVSVSMMGNPRDEGSPARFNTPILWSVAGVFGCLIGWWGRHL